VNHGFKKRSTEGNDTCDERWFVVDNDGNNINDDDDDDNKNEMIVISSVKFVVRFLSISHIGFMKLVQI
jgi:hypothetical protein